MYQKCTGGLWEKERQRLRHTYTRRERDRERQREIDRLSMREAKCERDRG